MINVLVSGATGKMGRASCAAIAADSELHLVAGIGRGESLAQAIAQHRPDVVLDLTVADVAFENARTIIESGVRPVIGTSGLSHEHVQHLQFLCKERALGGLVAPNFAIGAVLMMVLSRKVAPYFDRVEIIEAHHDRKLDAPSGTAVKTAEGIAEALGREVPALAEKELVAHARGASLSGVKIHSLRVPGVVAEQQVVFGTIGQTLRIEHRSIDRESFMPGVLLSCKKVMGLQELVYGLEHILEAF